MPPRILRTKYNKFFYYTKIVEYTNCENVWKSKTLKFMYSPPLPQLQLLRSISLNLSSCNKKALNL